MPELIDKLSAVVITADRPRLCSHKPV